MIRVAIIGTAGRRDDDTRLSSHGFLAMCNVTRAHIKQIRRAQPDTLIAAVSGGAAWADHIAVELFLTNDVDALELHLPCSYDMKSMRFQDIGSCSLQTNPGGTANYYHRKFSKTVNRNSRKEIYQAINKGAKVHIWDGFHARNQHVAQSDYMLALTFGRDGVPKPGGTRHTWNAAPKYCKKIHIPLSVVVR
jgi:hypothetical protein